MIVDMMIVTGKFALYFLIMYGLWEFIEWDIRKDKRNESGKEDY